MALALWCAVSVYASPEIERTITNVPVSIDLRGSTPERLGLQMFGNTEFYVDVVIRGPRYRASENMFSIDDLRVTANTGYVDTAGETQLSLKAEITDTNSDVEIVSLSRQSVPVYFDTLMQAVYTLEPEVRFPDGVDPVPDGYILDTPIVSVASVTVSGPSREVAKIKRVVARVENEHSLTVTTTGDAQIFMLTDSNTSPSYCTCAVEDVTVTTPVKKIVTLPVGVDFTNVPLAYVSAPLSYVAEPTAVQVALGTDVVDAMTAVSVGSIDFSDIRPGENSFTFAVSDNDTVKFLDDGLKEVTVRVNTGEVSTRDYQVTLSNISSVNLPPEYSVSYNTASTVTVTAVGPETSLDALTAAGIFAQVDYAGVPLSEGRQTVPAVFSVRTQTDCWCIGKYMIEADITAAATTAPATQSGEAES